MSDQMLIKAAAKSLRINPVEKDKKPDRNRDGTVRAVNTDGTYAVALDDAPDTPITCMPYCTAMVGDRVAVVLRSDGVCVATGRLGGEVGGGGEVVMTVNDASNYVAGRVFAHAGTNDPAGALLCDGRAVSRTTYWELFDAIGTTYGAGDGASTFNLPNIESRTIIGESDSYALGSTGGEEKHKLTVDEMPEHEHRAHTVAWVSPSTSDSAYSAMRSVHLSNQYGTELNSRVAEAGGSQPHNNMQPYIVMRYFITTGKGDPVSGINPADYVIDWKANDNGWFWRKWASGKAECWRDVEMVQTNITGGPEVFVVWPTIKGVQFPFVFAEPPSFDYDELHDTTNCGQVLSVTVIGNDYISTTNAPELLVHAGYAFDNGTTWKIRCRFDGFWKTPSASGGTETIAPTIEERFAELESRLAEAEYDTGWENVYYVSDSMYVKARRVGKQVTVVGKSSGYYELPAGEYRDVTTLPEKFRPSVDIQFAKHNQGGAATADSNYVSPDGRVRMYTAESGNRYWGFSVSYPVD